MRRLTLGVAVTTALLSSTAFAAVDISDAKSCAGELTIVKGANEEQDLGAKAEAEVARLIAELEKQCASSSFPDAGKTAEQIRGMLASEDDSGKDDKEDDKPKAAKSTPTEITSKKDCADELAVVKAANDDKDVGPKAEAEIDKLIVEMSKQCGEGALSSAAKTADTIRGMLATE